MTMEKAAVGFHSERNLVGGLWKHGSAMLGVLTFMETKLTRSDTA
jgi:hypothetical protein